MCFLQYLCVYVYQWGTMNGTGTAFASLWPSRVACSVLELDPTYLSGGFLSRYAICLSNQRSCDVRFPETQVS